MSDVPRSANGWPTIDPAQFTDLQLIREAYSWYSTAKRSLGNTVGSGQWDKYTAELVKRGVMSEDDRQGFTPLTNLPWFIANANDLIPKRRPWWRFWS